MDTNTQENLMQRYLLGALPDEEASRLEEAFFTDDETFERLWEVENRLVDRYVRGKLAAADRERFEHHYLASPVHRQRVAVSKHLVEEADAFRREIRIAEPAVSGQTKLFERLGFSPSWWRLAATAATLVLVAISLWLFLDRLRLQNEFAHLQAEITERQSRERELAEQIATARGENEKRAAELEQLRSERDTLAGQISRPPTPSGRMSVFSFLLSPLLVRGSSSPQTVTLPSGIDEVRLQMRVDGSAAQRYQIAIRTVEGQAVWQQSITQPRRSSAESILLTTRIPTNKLSLGDYLLTLSAVNPKGESEEINRYYFRVLRK